MRKKRGIVLITTMLFVTVIVMIATLIATQGKMALQSGTISMQSEEAYMAALSGIDFVRGELRKDRSFGEKTLSGYTHKVPGIATNGVLIKYIGNNLWGYLGATSENDYKSKFVISFAKPTNTTFNNTNFKHTTSACKYVSVNNVSSTSTINEDIDNGIRRKVPPYTMYIVSKGVCGKSVRYAEAILTSNGPVVVDNGTTIGGEIKITGDKDITYTGGVNSLLTVKHSDTNNPGQLNACNSKGECTEKIKLEGNGANTEDLLNLTNKVVMNGNFDNSKIKDETLASNLSVSQNAVVNMEDLKSLTFEDAKNSINSALTQSNLKSGSYIYARTIEGEGDNKKVVGKWCYVDNPDLKDAIKTLSKNQDKDFSVEKMPDGIPKGISFGTSDSEKLSTGNKSRTVVINGNITTLNDGNVNFAVADRTVNKKEFVLSDSSVDLQLSSGGSISVNKGDLNINGEVTGNGNLIANGNVEFNAGSSIEVDENQKVAVWAKDDININRAKNISNKRFKELYGSNEATIETTNGNVTVNLTPQELERALIGETGDLANKQVDPTTNNVDSNVINKEIEKYTPIVIENALFDEKIKVFQYNSNLYFIYLQQDNSYVPDSTSEYNGIKPRLASMTLEDYNKYLADGINPVEKLTNFKNKNNGAWELNDFRFEFRQTNDMTRGDYNIFVKYDGEYYYYKTFKISGGTGINDGLCKFNGGVEDHVDCIDMNQQTNQNNTKYTPILVANNLNPSIKSKIEANLNAESQAVTLEDGTTDTPPLAEVAKSDAIIAISNKIVNSDTKLRGTVYSAEGKINIKIGNTCFDIIGALIAPNGKLDISAKKVVLTYDPDYVPFFSDLGVNTNVGFLSSFVGGEN